MASSVSDRPRTGQTSALARREVTGIPEVLAPFVPTFQLDRSRLDLIKRVCAPPEATDDQLALYFHLCARRGVDPLDRLVIMTLFRDKESQSGGGKKPVFISTIDYLRSQADENPDYAGQSEPVYGAAVHRDGTTVPEWAKVVVYKMVKGRKRPYVGKVLWAEFYPGPGDRGALWRAKPFHMLAKCAEAQALRKAFPKRLSRLYTRAELTGEFQEPVPQLVDADDPPIEPPTRGRAKKAAAALPDIEAAPAGGAGDPLHWHVVPVGTALVQESVTKRAPRKPIWKAVLENGVGQRRDVYTFDPAMATALRQLGDGRRVFEISLEKNGAIDVITETHPL